MIVKLTFTALLIMFLSMLMQKNTDIKLHYLWKKHWILYEWAGVVGLDEAHFKLHVVQLHWLYFCPVKLK